jgi:hypothetical protein
MASRFSLRIYTIFVCKKGGDEEHAPHLQFSTLSFCNNPQTFHRKTTFRSKRQIFAGERERDEWEPSQVCVNFAECEKRIFVILMRRNVLATSSFEMNEGEIFVRRFL